MAWKYEDNTLVPPNMLPPKLVGEGTDANWVDQGNRPIKTNTAADYPVPAPTSPSPFPLGVAPDFSNQKIFEAIQTLSGYLHGKLGG